MIVKALLAIASVATVALFFVLQTTSPSTIHPVGLLGVFILLYIIATVIATFLLHSLSGVYASMMNRFSPRAVLRTGLRFSRAYVYATVFAFAPVVLIAMQSVGGVGLIDVVLVAVFILVATFYIWRRQ